MDMKKCRKDCVLSEADCMRSCNYDEVNIKQLTVMIFWQVNVVYFYPIFLATIAFSERLSWQVEVLYIKCLLLQSQYFFNAYSFGVGDKLYLVIGRFTYKLAWESCAEQNQRCRLHCFPAWLPQPRAYWTCKGRQQRSYDQKGRNDWQNSATSKELME